MIKDMLTNEKPAIGIVGGAICWYTAHELSFYFSNMNCDHRWLLPTIHALTFLGSIYCGIISYRALTNKSSHPRENITFMAAVSTLAALLFSIVIVWQGIATIIYKGCER